jgi:hypothetical protein
MSPFSGPPSQSSFRPGQAQHLETEIVDWHALDADRRLPLVYQGPGVCWQ